MFSVPVCMFLGENSKPLLYFDNLSHKKGNILKSVTFLERSGVCLCVNTENATFLKNEFHSYSQEFLCSCVSRWTKNSRIFREFVRKKWTVSSIYHTVFSIQKTRFFHTDTEWTYTMEEDREKVNIFLLAVFKQALNVCFMSFFGSGGGQVHKLCGGFGMIVDFHNTDVTE